MMVRGLEVMPAGQRKTKSLLIKKKRLLFPAAIVCLCGKGICSLSPVHRHPHELSYELPAQVQRKHTEQNAVSGGVSTLSLLPMQLPMLSALASPRCYSGSISV
jgi:hypothetical protein